MDKAQLQKLGELSNDTEEDTIETLKKIADVHLEAYSQKTGIKLKIVVVQDVTRKDLALALGQVYEERSAQSSNEPNILLQRQRELRDKNEQFAEQCNKSNEYYQNLLNKEDEEA